MNPEAQRGKVIIFSVLSTILCSDILIIAMTVARKGFGDSGASIMRFFITLALFYAVILGRAWARWLTVGLMTIACLGMAAVLLKTYHPLIIGMTLLFGSAAGLLSFPPSVSAYFRHHRADPGKAV